jgi:hypothetical protein
MQYSQRSQNPDVNSTAFDDNVGGDEDLFERHGGHDSDIEHGHHDDDVTPVPPDMQPTVPIEDPPGTNEPPVGGIDDSPKKIAGK